MQKINIAKSELDAKSQQKGSLLDDFANPSTEPADFTAGDD